MPAHAKQAAPRPVPPSRWRRLAGAAVTSPAAVLVSALIDIGRAAVSAALSTIRRG